MKGSLAVTIAGKTAVIGPGGAAFVHSNELHGVVNPGTENAQYFVVATGVWQLAKNSLVEWKKTQGLKPS
jgi:mannose-6-phosphate isomerase-like protein (cupin superfamily)